MENNALARFRKLRIFDGLPADVIDTLFSKGRIVELHSGNELFAQGGPSDELYILLHGRLLAIGFDPVMNTEHVSGFIQPGEVVGEMGLITRKPRSLTVRSQLDSTLFRLGENEFRELLESHPEVLAPITRTIVWRLQQTLTQSYGATSPQTVMLMPANKGIEIQAVLEKLRIILEESDVSFTMVSEQDAQAKFGEQSDGNEMSQWMADLDQSSDLVLLCCTDLASDWFRHGLQFAERFVVIADGDSESDYDPGLLDKLGDDLHQHYVKELLLLGHGRKHDDSNVTAWLQGVEYYRHHHVVLENRSSVERFCRFLTGRANALVLAGGGTRGWAHVGAMRAFYERGLEFDLVGGTSAGSVVAALYAAGEGYNNLCHVMDMLLRASLEVVKVSNYTLPLVSISNAKANTMLLQEVFSDMAIEELGRLFFCVSCNINRSEETIHTQGLLWQALRASCSVPGIAPPVVIDGEMYVDGGIINNMPVDVARQRLDGMGHVVAVDLSMTKEETTRYDFPPILSLPHLLAHRMKLIKHDYRFSSLGNIIMDTMMACSERRMAENRELTDVLIRPSLQGYGMMDNARDELMELGYQAAIEAL